MFELESIVLEAKREFLDFIMTDYLEEILR